VQSDEGQHNIKLAWLGLTCESILSALFRECISPARNGEGEEGRDADTPSDPRAPTSGLSGGGAPVPESLPSWLVPTKDTLQQSPLCQHLYQQIEECNFLNVTREPKHSTTLDCSFSGKAGQQKTPLTDRRCVSKSVQ
jgi:hypothetical protein